MIATISPAAVVAFVAGVAVGIGFSLVVYAVRGIAANAASARTAPEASPADGDEPGAPEASPADGTAATVGGTAGAEGASDQEPGSPA